MTLELIDAAIADLEAKLNLPPGGSISLGGDDTKKKAQVDKQKGGDKKNNTKKEKKNNKKNNNKKGNTKKAAGPNVDQPDICKLEFKVGQITKVWVHPSADKLYCEEIDCGEETPRQIASGLRPHYTLDQMRGQRLIVVSNLKTRKLAGFPSAGMVLCAAEKKDDGTEMVEFVEPPPGAKIGEQIVFEGLPTPEPFTGAQVEKKKVFQACADGMKTTDEGIATWNGHAFMTSAGPCKSPTIRNGPMR